MPRVSAGVRSAARRRPLIQAFMAALVAIGAARDSRAADVSVPPLAHQALAPQPSTARGRHLVQAYYDSILAWGQIVAPRVTAVPDMPDGSYLGRDGHRENDVRPTAYAALVLAFLARFDPPQPRLEEPARRRMQTHAVALLRYLTRSHGSAGGACRDGQPWGRQWQSAMWARAVGLAAWLLWPRLDEPLQQAVVGVVEAEADRFRNQDPKSSLRGDTGAEENAWNAALTSLAGTMLPGHPHAAAWSASAKRYMYNTFSVAADSRDTTRGDDGRPVQDWVTTVNAHDDFLVENHGLTHVGYLKTAAAELQENAVHYLLAGQPVPAACSHHLPEVFEVLVACQAWDGSPVFFGGNDWKTFHSQASDIVVHAVRSVVAGDRRAAYLEAVGLDWLTRIQAAEQGYYNVRRDLEYGGLCATRLIACCLVHGLRGEGAVPVSGAEFDRAATGVRSLPSAGAILHRTPTKFASFAWSHQRLALALPRDGNWVLWPHLASALGLLNGEPPAQQHADLAKFRVQPETDGFRVQGTLRRCRGRVTQDFCFVSPPGDYTVYVERLRVRSGFRLTARETGIVGLAYELGANTRLLQGQFGTHTAVGYGGQPQLHQWSTDWLNIGDRVGYVVRRPDDTPNLVRYHDEAQGTGRVPELQEWLSLIGSAASSPPGPHDAWACLVTFLNQPARETAAWARRVTLHVDGDHARCQIGSETCAVDFAPP